MLNQNAMLLITVVAVVVGVLGVTLGLFPYLKKKGYSVDKTLDTAQDVLQKAGSALDVAGEILPANPVINVLSIIEKWAKIAAGDAQQLYHAGDIEKEERAAIAEEVVINVLKELNITLDDNKKALIDAAIKNAVNDLGHAPADVKAQQEAQEQLQKSNDTLQATNSTLQQQNSQLNSENTQLKQTISTIQNTVQAAQPTAATNDSAVSADTTVQ